MKPGIIGGNAYKFDARNGSFLSAAICADGSIDDCSWSEIEDFSPYSAEQISEAIERANEDEYEEPRCEKCGKREESKLDLDTRGYCILCRARAEGRME